MNKARGYVQVFGPEGTSERETFTCCHCNKVFPKPPADAREIGYCGRCDARECVPCAKRLNGRCTPFEKKLAAYEQKQRMLAALGVA